MKPYLLSLAASLLAAPLAVQAQMEMLSDDDLSAIHGEGIYTHMEGSYDPVDEDAAASAELFEGVFAAAQARLDADEEEDGDDGDETEEET